MFGKIFDAVNSQECFNDKQKEKAKQGGGKIIAALWRRFTTLVKLTFKKKGFYRTTDFLQQPYISQVFRAQQMSELICQITAGNLKL